jgi:hypothetical protein
LSPTLRIWILSRREPPSDWAAALRAEGWSCAQVRGSAGCRPAAGELAWALVDSGSSGELEAAARAGCRCIVFGPLESMPASEVIRLLEAGADDVLSSLIPGRLLAAKLKAHARVAAPPPEATLWSPSKTLKLDLRRKRAFLRGAGGRWKALADLTSTEFEILGLLLKGAGGPVERQFILETLWREQALDVRSDSVNKHVQALRRKLDRHGAFVKSLYGVGYAWREE